MRLRPQALLLVPVALLAACGGATTSHQSTAAPDRSLSAQTQQDPLAAAQESTATSTSKAADGVAATKSHRSTQTTPRPDPISTGKQKPSKARGQFPSTRVHELKPSGASILSPCTLVTRSEAQAILGQPIAGLQKAVQGPTCIYRQRDTKRLITVALQHVRLTAAQRRGKQVVRVNVAGHKGYCLKQGTLMMLVPLRDGQVLNVSAACPIAARFATKALARLGG
jgi:hypothetical protein